jgi:hypothetical protein
MWWWRFLGGCRAVEGRGGLVGIMRVVGFGWGVDVDVIVGMWEVSR